MSVRRTSTKYGTIKPRILEWERHYHALTPRMSDHLLFNQRNGALGRWDERTTWDSRSPEHAWKNGVDVSPLRKCDDLQDGRLGPPESAVYYFEETEQGVNEVVLVERENVVTTVLLVEQFSSDVKTILRSLRELVE